MSTVSGIVHAAIHLHSEGLMQAGLVLLILTPIARVALAVVGFALETNNEEKNAIEKLQKKNLDFIVLNSLNDKGAGFKTDTNKITIIDHNLQKTTFDLKDKNEVAKDICNKVAELIK